jgi:hypothetical protein
VLNTDTRLFSLWWLLDPCSDAAISHSATFKRTISVQLRLPLSQVFAGIAALDVGTGFDITRLAVRYGGPGAPTSAVIAFWPTAIAAAGVLSTLLTSVLNLEAFGLKAKCPECDTTNRAGFKGVLGGTESEITRVVCPCLNLKMHSNHLVSNCWFMLRHVSVDV